MAEKNVRKTKHSHFSKLSSSRKSKKVVSRYNQRVKSLYSLSKVVDPLLKVLMEFWRGHKIARFLKLHYLPILLRDHEYLMMDKMRNFIAYYWYDSKVEPMTGLTKYEVYLVQKSWKVLNAHPIKAGALIFNRLFIAYPETKEFFRTIRHVAEDDLATNGQFKAHALNFMSNFNNFVTNLQQPEISAALMNKLGESHAQRRIKKGHFRDLKIVLTGILRDDLHLDKTTMDAWSKTVDFMCKHIFETMIETGKE